jgi:hypothetical protein
MRVEPGLVSVKDLLLKAHSGDWSLWLPSFQRRFVWDPVDIKAFLDSLLKGNPVGILLLWRSKNPKDSDPFALRVLFGGGKSSQNYLIVDGQQRVLSLLLLLNGWSIRVGDILLKMEYTTQPISFNPTKYVLEVGKRGLDLSEGMRAHLGLGLEDMDGLKRKYVGEYVDRLLGLCERIASYRIPVYFMDLDDEKSPLERAAEIFILANRAGQRITNVELILSYVSGVLIPEASLILLRRWFGSQAEADRRRGEVQVRRQGPLCPGGFDWEERPRQGPRGEHPVLQVSDRAGQEVHRERRALLPHDPTIPGDPRDLYALKGL